MIVWIFATLLIGDVQPILVMQDTNLGIPFYRFSTTDSLGRTITGYLSKSPKSAAGKKLPVILFVQGSGSQSLWTKHGDRIGGGLQNLWLQTVGVRARILAVEKPGVKFLDWPKQPGSATEGSKEFLTEHTLPRWGEANVAAVKAVLTLPDVDSSRVLTVGHSEGGIVAARVAAEVPAVTHVASLAGGGPSQLFSLASLARRNAPAGQATLAVKSVFDDWAKVLAKPDSIDDFWMGHPYCRWSGFLKYSVGQELRRTKARVFIANGTADPAEAIEGFDVLHAELLAQGRDVTAKRVEGGDHGFSTQGTIGQAEGLKKMFADVLEWFVR